jgi:hypothetical protein
MDSTYIALFLCQIGSQASLIYYIYISFSTFNDFPYNRARLYNIYIKNLELIRDIYISITLELLLLPDYINYALYNLPIIIKRQICSIYTLRPSYY